LRSKKEKDLDPPSDFAIKVAVAYRVERPIRQIEACFQYVTVVTGDVVSGPPALLIIVM